MYKIDDNMIQIIEKILERGDKIELIPTSNGVKVYKLRRREIKMNDECPPKSED